MLDKHDIDSRPGHRYRAIAEAIRDAITDGRVVPGNRLPTHRKLADELGVTTATVAHGYELATEWGLLVSRVGSGTRIAEPTAGRPITNAEPGQAVNLGLLKPARIHDGALTQRAYGQTLARVGATMAQLRRAYPPELGFLADRSAGAEWLSTLGLPANPQSTIVCQGAQTAFLLLMSMFTRSGDPVLLEGHAYIGLKNMCRALKRRPIPVAMDGAGMLPRALAAAARKSSAKIVFITPFCQNPTTAVSPLQRQQEIAEYARKLDLTIVEDDPFSGLVGKGRSLVATFAPERSFYVHSLSKLANPGVRIAYLFAPQRYLADLEAVQHSLLVAGPSLDAAVATHWINTGILSDLCRGQREEIKCRQQIAVDELRETPCKFKINDSAPFIWASFPETIDHATLSAEMLKCGVICIPAERFTAGRGVTGHYIRIALTTCENSGQLVAGLRALKSVLARLS